MGEDYKNAFPFPALSTGRVIARPKKRGQPQDISVTIRMRRGRVIVWGFQDASVLCRQLAACYSRLVLHQNQRYLSKGAREQGRRHTRKGGTMYANTYRESARAREREDELGVSAVNSRN